MIDDLIVHQLRAEVRRLTKQLDRLRRTIVDESGDKSIDPQTADLQTLIALVKELGLRARQFDEEMGKASKEGKDLGNGVER
jgi:hypothetical protein